MSGKKLIITVKDLYNLDEQGNYLPARVIYHVYAKGKKILTNSISGKVTSQSGYVVTEEIPDCPEFPAVEFLSLSPHAKVMFQVVDFEVGLPN